MFSALSLQGRARGQREAWTPVNPIIGIPGQALKTGVSLPKIDEAQPPRRFIAGADAITTAEQLIATLQAQIDAYRALSTTLSHVTA